MQMRLIPWRDLQRRRVDLGETVVIEPAAQGLLDAVTRDEDWAAVRMARGMPPRGLGWAVDAVGHGVALSV
jgi:hypothetical protein